MLLRKIIVNIILTIPLKNDIIYAESCGLLVSNSFCRDFPNRIDYGAIHQQGGRMKIIKKGYLIDGDTECPYDLCMRYENRGEPQAVYFRESKDEIEIVENPRKMEKFFAELLWVLTFFHHRVVGTY